MRIEFEVHGHLPPKKDGATSMWSKDGDVDALVELRRRALAANPSKRLLSHGIRLVMEIHVPNPESRRAGDLDNYVTGVCDGLMCVAGRAGMTPSWDQPHVADVHPNQSIAIADDSAIIEIVARKFSSKGPERWYRVILEGESEPQPSVETVDVNHAALRGILDDVGACKRHETCKRLTIRELFFEPNPHTVSEWQRSRGFYPDGIDPRVVFVCENPSDRKPRDREEGLSVNGQRLWVCWNYTWQDSRFRDLRVKYGLEHCLITNAVKCGPKRPSVPAKLTDEEISNCSGFLRREIEAIHPRVIACLGRSAWRIVQSHVLPKLSWAPASVQLTHYSHRCSNEELFRRWEKELHAVQAHLARRGAHHDAT